MRFLDNMYFTLNVRLPASLQATSSGSGGSPTAARLATGDDVTDGSEDSAFHTVFPAASANQKLAPDTPTAQQLPSPARNHHHNRHQQHLMNVPPPPPPPPPGDSSILTPWLQATTNEQQQQQHLRPLLNSFLHEHHSLLRHHAAAVAALQQCPSLPALPPGPAHPALLPPPPLPPHHPASASQFPLPPLVATAAAIHSLLGQWQNTADGSMAGWSHAARNAVMSLYDSYTRRHDDVIAAAMLNNRERRRSDEVHDSEDGEAAAAGGCTSKMLTTDSSRVSAEFAKLFATSSSSHHGGSMLPLSSLPPLHHAAIPHIHQQPSGLPYSDIAAMDNNRCQQFLAAAAAADAMSVAGRPHQFPSSVEMTNASAASLSAAEAACKRHFTCDQCRYVTDRKNNLKRHVATMHQDCEKALECCGLTFRSKATLRDHVTLFHNNGYTCRYCARNFCRKALLRRHLAVHSGRKDYNCASCDYATSHKSNLERHKRVHERGGSSGASSAAGGLLGVTSRSLSLDDGDPDLHLQGCGDTRPQLSPSSDDLSQHYAPPLPMLQRRFSCGDGRLEDISVTLDKDEAASAAAAMLRRTMQAHAFMTSTGVTMGTPPTLSLMNDLNISSSSSCFAPGINFQLVRRQAAIDEFRQKLLPEHHAATAARRQLSRDSPADGSHVAASANENSATLSVDDSSAAATRRMLKRKRQTSASTRNAVSIAAKSCVRIWRPDNDVIAAHSSVYDDVTDPSSSPMTSSDDEDNSDSAAGDVCKA